MRNLQRQRPLLIAGLVVLLAVTGWPLVHWMHRLMAAQETMESRLKQFGEKSAVRWRPHFERAGLSFPPTETAWLAFKEEKRLDVYAREPKGQWKFIRSCAIKAASGQAGPKLREGDRQVPEGFYAIEIFNPNSRFHVSLRLNYPNDFDREQAKRERRTNLGGDIMIHGNAVSIGCLAMGDEVAEDLFTLAARTGKENVRVLISPHDFRIRPEAPKTSVPEWMTPLYDSLRKTLRDYPGLGS